MWYIVLLVSAQSFAATFQPKIVKESNASQVVVAVYKLLAEFTLLFGIAMVVAALYKYTEYRQNPLGNPLGRVVTILMIGAALIGLYFVPMQSF